MKIFSAIGLSLLIQIPLADRGRAGESAVRARVLRIPRPSGFAFWEFELGSLGAHPGPAAMGTRSSWQPFGVTGEALFGECTFNTTVADPTATIRIVDPEGTVRYQVTLTRSQLTPPERKPTGALNTRKGATSNP